MTAPAPWLGHYDPGVPATLAPYPERTLTDYLGDAAREQSDSPAIYFKGTTLTFADVERLSDAGAAAFASLGVRPGDRVALVLPNCPQFVIAQFALWKIGAIVAPLNPTYSEGELEVPLREHGIELVITLTRFYERVKATQHRTSIKRVVATNIKDFFPPVLKALFTLVREKRDGDRITLRDGDLALMPLFEANRGRRPTRQPLKMADAAVLLMSGGTTGIPKGVLGTHGAYTMAGLQIAAWLRSIVEGETRAIFAPLPLFHVYSNVGIQALSIIARLPIALVPNPRDIPDLVSTLRKVKPAFFNGVPTLYIALLNHPAVQRGKVDFKSIRICVSGAAALMADTKQRFEAITGGRIVEGYSLTEAMMGLCVNPVKGANKLGSVGMPLPDVQVKIVDGDEGIRELATGEVGEIIISAPQLMSGYWNRPAESAEILRARPDGAGGSARWLHTGDLGYLDEDGYVFIVDRKKDLIKPGGGFQVWPREVEETLAAHPAVAEVGVAGAPHPSKGEIVKAWVVIRAGHQATEQELRDFCRERLAPFKVPSAIEFRNDLPKTMVGKVLRRALRDS
ncbi:MAG TPA: long-chain fatty acid--CoA ligase [Vicinamibacterales bacterium]